MLKTALLSTLLATAVVTPALSADNLAPAKSASSASSVLKQAPHFTQEQARIHLARQGYVNISPLIRNANGAWQGTAEKSGRKLIVAVGF